MEVNCAFWIATLCNAFILIMLYIATAVVKFIVLEL
jgi:hypothetical protein